LLTRSQHFTLIRWKWMFHFRFEFTPMQSINFHDPDLLTTLQQSSAAELDQLEFGVIGFDLDGVVKAYNETESRYARFNPKRIIDTDLFNYVAPCMNNYLVAQRFHDSQKQGVALDENLDYVLTLRMRPTKVRLRLLANPAHALRYVLVLRGL
jgi:photoactive yellow protein